MNLQPTIPLTGSIKHFNKYTHIKKQVIAQKYKQLVGTSKLLLFFHYNSSRGCNWHEIKKSLGKQIVGGGVPCKGLLLPSNLFATIKLHPVVLNCVVDAPSKKTMSKDKWRFFTQGPTLLVACSSVEQMFTVMKTCSPPAFLCIGGVYNNQPLSHLDIKRWFSLENNAPETHTTLLRPLMEWQKLISLLNLPQHLLNIPPLLAVQLLQLRSTQNASPQPVFSTR